MVTSTLPRFGCSSQSSLLTVSEAATRYKLHPNTIRNWTASGKLATAWTVGKHRRLEPKAIESLLGISDGAAGEGENCNGAIRVAAVVRVSSAGQNIKNNSSDMSSLDYQKARVKDFIESKYPGAEVTWYVSVGSGMNFERPEFLRLVKDILEGKFRGGKVIASTFDRVCRFGIHLVEYLCGIGGCELEYVLDSDDGEKSGNESLVTDVLSILTHYSAKASGAKTKQIVTVHMAQKDLDEAWDLYSKKSWSQAAINDKFVKEGRCGQTASGKVKKLTRGPVYRRLTAYFELKRKIEGESDKVNSFQQWAQTHIRKINDAGRFNEVGLTALRAKYVEYCHKNNLHPIDNRGILKYLTAQGFETYTVRNGMRRYKSMMLLDDRGSEK